MRITSRLAALFVLVALGAAPGPAAADTGSPGSFPYGLAPLTDAALGAAGLGLYGSSLYFQSIKAKPDQSALDAAAIPAFDRLYTSSQSAWMGTAADALMVGTALVPAALIPGREGRQLLTLGAMYAETLGLAYALDESLKSIVTRYRPYAHSSSAPSSDFADSDVYASFPSRHATIAFASAVFAGSVFDELNPRSPWRPLVWASGLGLATITSALRVASGDHFPSDVLAGAVFGALLGCLAPLVHEGTASGPGSSLALGALPSRLTVKFSLE
jgi:membrane-associated phospholipid phosphatase